jgi:hypothetical protein
MPLFARLPALGKLAAAPDARIASNGEIRGMARIILTFCTRRKIGGILQCRQNFKKANVVAREIEFVNHCAVEAIFC